MTEFTHSMLEQMVREMALLCMNNKAPQANIAPYLDLCRNAISLGCVVLRNDDERLNNNRTTTIGGNGLNEFFSRPIA